MRTLRAVRQGLTQATTSAGLIACLWLVGLAAALPYAMVVRDSIQRSVGASRMHLDLREGFDMDWYSEYLHEAVGVGRLLTPTSVRPAAFLDNLEAWFSGDLFLTQPGLVALGVAFALGWALLVGGILHRFVYFEKGLSLRSLLGHGAELFPRYARLLVISGALYYLVYRFARWLFPRLEEALRDVTVERTTLAVHLAGAALVVLLLLLVKLTSDYAKVATILEGRRSMLLAAWRGLRFVLGHPLRTFGAYALVAVVGLALLALYALIAPGQAQASLAGVLWAFLVGQAFLALRIVQRLTAYAAAVEIYRDATP